MSPGSCLVPVSLVMSDDRWSMSETTNKCIHGTSLPLLKAAPPSPCARALMFATKKTVVAAASVALVAACRAVVEERRVEDFVNQERSKRLALGLVKEPVKEEAEVSGCGCDGVVSCLSSSSLLLYRIVVGIL